ncbi:hypothetical protein ABFY09_02580 [Marinomonas sp. 5E14-1]
MGTIAPIAIDVVEIADLPLLLTVGSSIGLAAQFYCSATKDITDFFFG